MADPLTFPPALVIAAPHSGSGKTTVTAGLIAALVARGLRVARRTCRATPQELPYKQSFVGKEWLIR